MSSETDDFQPLFPPPQRTRTSHHMAKTCAASLNPRVANAVGLMTDSW